MADISLFDENQKLVHHIVNKHFWSYPDREDITQVGLLALYRASIKFDPEKAQFSTYAYNTVKREIFKFLKKNSKKKVERLVDYDIIDYRSEDRHVNIRDVLPWVSDHELDILNMKLKGIRYSEIGKKYKCSSQRIGFIVRSIYKRWKSQES